MTYWKSKIGIISQSILCLITTSSKLHYFYLISKLTCFGCKIIIQKYYYRHNKTSNFMFLYLIFVNVLSPSYNKLQRCVLPRASKIRLSPPSKPFQINHPICVPLHCGQKIMDKLLKYKLTGNYYLNSSY
jgi:hypothetical protein